MTHVFDVEVPELPQNIAYAVFRNDEDKLTDSYAKVSVSEVPQILQFAVEFAFETGVKKIGYTEGEAVLEVVRMTLETLDKAKKKK